MKPILPAALREATQLTRAGKLAEATAALRGLLGRAEVPTPPTPSASPAPGAAGRFLSASFTNAAGTRPYKLYVPSRVERPALVLMLHGCTQSPDDFARGTRMNQAAERAGCLVAYPEQTKQANAQKCWNWFLAAEQRRDAGEPALLAGLTRAVMAEYGADPARVFVAGLSAGGAAAAVLGETYPDLFAAIGVHSGLACGAARDLPSALAAMRQGSGGRGGARVPAIVFHGDRDQTVNPRNGEAVIAQAAGGGRTRTERGQVPGGHGYDRILHLGPDGRVAAEHWVVHGATHAWSGGDPAGTYTDPRGPDATSEMLRFFLEHPR